MTKFSVYGDSVALGLAERMRARQPTKLASYNDYARGGNSLAANLAGDCNGPLFGGLSFDQHVRTADDAQVVVVHLGANDRVMSAAGGQVSIGSGPYGYIGSDPIFVAINALLHVQHAMAAGKRVVMCGFPFYDPARLMLPPFSFSSDQSKGVACHTVAVNAALRLAAGAAGAIFVATYGAPAQPDQPVPDINSTVDGVHPTEAYGVAVANHVADNIVLALSL